MSVSLSDALSTQLTLEYAKGELDTERPPQIANVPTPGSDADSLVRAVRAIRQVIDAREGRSGSVLDKHLSLRDLLGAGLVSLAVGNQKIVGDLAGSTLTGNGGTVTVTVGGSGSGPGYVDPRPVYPTPPAMTGLTVTGVFRSIIVSWDTGPINYANFAYVEVWRNTVNNLASAALVGTSTSMVYVDTPGTIGTTYYYWVRSVATDGTLGPFNAVGGTPGGVQMIGNTDLSSLVITADKLAVGAIDALDKFIPGMQPIGYVAVLPNPVGYTGPTTIYNQTNGKLYRLVSGAWTAAVPAGDVTGQLTSSQIAAGAIVAGKLAAGAIVAGDGAIANAAITNALIANLAVDNAKIADATIAAAKIASVDATTITVGKLTGSQIAASTITGGNIAANTVTAGNIDSRGLSVRDGSGNLILGAGSAVDWTKLGGAASNLAGLGYSGALNATYGATFGTNISGQITSVNVSTYIAAAAIGYSQIGSLSVGLMSTAINGGAGSGARVDMASNVIRVYDASNVLRVKIGNLA